MNADFNPGDPFALFRQFWQAATPPGAQPFLPPMTEEDLDRKLAEPCWLLDDYALLVRWAAAKGDLLLGKEAEMRQKSIRAGLGEQACLAVSGALR